MEDITSDSERSSGESESSSHASAPSGAHTSGETCSDATVAGPSRGWGAPPGFEGVPPRRGAAEAEVEWLRARVARLESAWAESEARATRLVGANLGAQSRILALEGEAERLKRQHEAEVAALRSEARVTRFEGTSEDAQGRALALGEELERLRQQHEAEVSELRSELRMRLRPEGVDSALERSYFDAFRLSRRLASLEDPGFRVGVLDPRNSQARTRNQLVDYHVQDSSTGHWDH